jgi:hypothetical protein
MGSQWEAMAVTDIGKFESEHRHGKNASATTNPSKWVFPRYVKIYILERLLPADTVHYHHHHHHHPTNNKVEKEGENTIDIDKANGDDHDHDDIDWIGWVDSDN